MTKPRTAIAAPAVAPDVLAAARGHFQRMSTQTITIEEWQVEGKPTVVHFGALSWKDRADLEKLGGGEPTRLLAHAIVRHAKDADGNPLFPNDAATLAALQTEVDSRVVSRISNAILGVGAEEELGN